MLNFNKRKLPFVLIAFYYFSPCVAHAESCNALLAAGKLDSAIEAGRRQADAEGWLCAGRGLSASAKYPDALSAFKKAESLATSPYEQMLVAISTARAIRDSGDADLAIAAYQRGFDLATQLKQKQAQLVNLNEMGQLLLDKNDTKGALERFTQAYPYAANDNERAESNQLLASAYRQLGDYNHAIEHQLKGVLLEHKSGDLGDFLYAELELADLRMLSKDFQAAHKDIEDVLAKSREVQSDYWIARAQLYQGKLEIARGNPAAGRTYLQQSLALASKVGDADLIQMINNAMEQGQH